MRAVDVEGKMCYPCKVQHKDLGKCERAHYHCPICDSTFFIRQQFQNHVLSHNKSLQAVNPEVTSVKDESVTQEENIAKLEQQPGEPKAKKKRSDRKECPICGLEMDQHSIGRHCRTIHQEEIVTPSVCADKQLRIFMVT